MVWTIKEADGSSAEILYDDLAAEAMINHLREEGKEFVMYCVSQDAVPTAEDSIKTAKFLLKLAIINAEDAKMMVDGDEDIRLSELIHDMLEVHYLL